jgi:molybdate transport system substrate-binding protein
MNRARPATALTLAALVTVTGCSSSTSSKSSATSAGSAGAGASASPSTGQPAIHGTVVVLAAASLTEAFTTLASQFEAANPGVKVTLSFGASSALAQQINAGAPADVFASAATKNLDQVIKAGGAVRGTNFVRNVMEIAVPPSNPAGITGVADLARSGVKVALCQPQVPCGATALKVFAHAKVSVTPVTEEADVKSTLTKVESDEVDAGLVYVTDVRAAGKKVKGIPIPTDINAATEYPIAALTKAPNAAGAAAFVAFVLSGAGQQVLAADGFEKP